MRPTQKAYFVISLIIAAAAIVLKPIYTKNYANVPNAFAPTHIAIATTSPCEVYALRASTNKIALPTEGFNALEPFRFYTIAGSSVPICALARNVITAPLSSLKLSANASDIENIEFINIAMGSESFYINKQEIAKLALNAHATNPAPTFEKASATSGVITLDLSSYKLRPSSEILNLYSTTMFDNIWLGYFYYFVSAPFLPLWLVCVLAWIALKPSRQNLAAKYQEPIALGLLLTLALILRLYHYDSFSLWGDELYSVGVTAYPNDSFASVFKDPGNPPFYNFLLKLWLHCFGYTSGAARSLSVVIGTLGVMGIYLLLRDHACGASERGNATSKDKAIESCEPMLIALLGAFLYAISFVAIAAAHEVRGYVLELALLPFVFYFLLHFLKTPKISNALGYVLLGAMVCNTHYFGSVIILAGFIASATLLWQATELSKEQKRKRLAILLLLDVLIASSLVPFFAITAFSQALTDTSFNTWIPAPSLDWLLLLVPNAIGSSSGAFVFIVLFLLAPMLKNRFLNFCMIVIALGVILPFIASFVRPIYAPKYAVYATYAFILALCATTLVLGARKVASKNASFLIALLVCMLGITLLDYRVQPIGWGDNSRAKFGFITLDSNNEASKELHKAQKSRIYIIDLNTIIALKQRQYEIYGFKPSAEFLRISVPELAQRHFHKGDILYFDSYYADEITQEALNALSARGARIQPIPFGIQEDKELKKSQDLIYKVIF